MNVLFMGTPEFAIPSLKTIINSHHIIVGVVTVPDKPSGRGLKNKLSPIKSFAIQNNLKVLQPENLEDGVFLDECKSLNADVAVVVAFRKLPNKLWQLFPKGTFNLHASLLPQYRGAAPMNWAIINGERETGVTTFFINESIDTGEIIDRKTIPIGFDDNLESIHDKLSVEGAELVLETLNSIETGTIETLNQKHIIENNSLNVLKKAPKIFKHHCIIDWSKPAEEIFNLIRGLSPVPCAFSIFQNINGKSISIKIFSVRVIDNASSFTEIIGFAGNPVIDKNSFYVQTGDGKFVELIEIQPESKKRMSAKEFVNGLTDSHTWFFQMKGESLN